MHFISCTDTSRRCRSLRSSASRRSSSPSCASSDCPRHRLTSGQSPEWSHLTRTLTVSSHHIPLHLQPFDPQQPIHVEQLIRRASSHTSSSRQELHFIPSAIPVPPYERSGPLNATSICRQRGGTVDEGGRCDQWSPVETGRWRQTEGHGGEAGAVWEGEVVLMVGRSVKNTSAD